MPLPSGKATGLNTEKLTQMTKIAQSPSPITGKVPNNALNHGNAEVQDFAKEEDGALVMMVVKEPHFQTKLQDFHQTTDQPSYDKLQISSIFERSEENTIGNRCLDQYFEIFKLITFNLENN